MTTTSDERNELIKQSNDTANRAFWISAFALLVSIGSLYYAHRQTSYFHRQTEIMEAERDEKYREKVVARIEVIQGVKPEVRLVIENNGAYQVAFNDILINGMHITDHPLFDKKQFGFYAKKTPEGKMDFIFLKPGTSATFLTVASVPSGQTAYQANSHPAIMVTGKLYDSVCFTNRVDFSRKLIFPKSYLQWMEAGFPTETKQPTTSQ